MDGRSRPFIDAYKIRTREKDKVYKKVEEEDMGKVERKVLMHNSLDSS